MAKGKADIKGERKDKEPNASADNAEGKVAGFRERLETLKPYHFERLWNVADYGGPAPFDDYPFQTFAHFFDRDIPIERAESDAYSGRQCYERIEAVLNRNEGDLVKRIVAERFGITDTETITYPTISMMAYGEEYAVYLVEFIPNIEFAVTISRHPKLNEAMEIEDKAIRELHAYETKLKGSSNVVPHWHYEAGDDEDPALTISPYVRGSYGVYIHPEHGDYHTGRKIHLGGSSSGKDDIDLMPSNKGGYFWETKEGFLTHNRYRHLVYRYDDSGLWGGTPEMTPEDDVFYQLVHHQLLLASSGRVVYVSPNFADYLYNPELNKLFLTRYRSPEFAKDNYTDERTYNHMYALENLKDVYDSAVDALYVQTLHLVYEFNNEGTVYPLNQISLALTAVIEQLSPDDREELLNRLLNEEPEPPKFRPDPEILSSEETDEIYEGRLRKFKQKLKRDLEES